jgi:hypothetical protein
VDSSFHSANILSVTMKGEPIPDFDPDITENEFTVPSGSTRYFAIDAELEAKDARFPYLRPASLPGLYTLSVTAVDGYTHKDYFIYVSVATGVRTPDTGTGLWLENPFGNSINGHLNLDQPVECIFCLYSPDGSLLMERPLGYRSAGENDFSLSPGRMARGSYLFRITGPGTDHKGILVK